MTLPRPVRARCAAWLALTMTAGCGAKTVSLGEWIPERDAGTILPDGSTGYSDANSDANERSFYLEAENGRLTGGFTIGSDPSASAGAYLAPPSGVTSLDLPGAARAAYAFDVADAGAYTIWGRIHSPDASHNTFWIQVDGAPWFVWRLATGDVWYWAPFHENLNYGVALTFDFARGPHELVIANSIEGNGLDRFYFTTGRAAPPGNDTPCNPPHSIEKSGACIPSCGSQGGNSCIPSECQGRPTLPAHDCSVCCIVR